MKILRQVALLFAAATVVTGCSAGGPSASASSPVHHHVELTPGAPGSETPLADPPEPTGNPAGQVTVYAADSLHGAFSKLTGPFQAAYPGTKLVFTFGSSATQAQQIVGGARVELFASADAATMKRVTDAGAAQGKPMVIARNALVIVVPKGNKANVNRLGDLSRSQVRVALCAQQVACGAAAQRVIDAEKVTVQAASILPDAKAVLAKVLSGEVDAGLVYRTDLTAAGVDVEAIDLEEAWRVADEYPIVTLKSGVNQAGAVAFVGFLKSALARRVLAEAGFGTP